MGFFKSEYQKAADRDERARRAFAASPVGKASLTHDRGDDLFQVSMRVDDESAQCLSQIEAVGWRLEHAGYAFKVSDDFGTLVGVYLFRRA